MMTDRRVSLSVLSVLLLFVSLSSASIEAQTNRQQRWVATWATAQQLMLPPAAGGGRGQQAPPPTTAPVPQAPPGQGAAAAPPGGRGRGALPRRLQTLKNQTVRMIVRTSLGGSRTRVRLSNAFGSAPVVVGAAHIAIRSKESAIVPASDRALTFAGKPSVTLLPGTVLLSDPVALEIPAVGDLAVSLYLPDDTGTPTSHLFGLHTTYVSRDGDWAGRAALEDATTTQSYYWLSGVDVLAPSEAGTIVALGDSLTDGDRSTVDADGMWPAVLAGRLRSNRRTANVGIVNLGIAGNQLLRDGGLGVSALARFDRDVLGQPGAKWLILLEGINDIGTLSRPGATVTADDLIAGLQQIGERARAHGLRVIGGTIPPFEGANTFSEAGEAVRQAVNTWIRTRNFFDHVVDFDAVLRDPANLRHLRAGLHADDNLHPNDAGYTVMANAIDLALFAQ